MYPGDLVFLCNENGSNNGDARHTLVVTDEGGKIELEFVPTQKIKKITH